MKLLQLGLIVLISALIGYITNVLAIKSLFRPLYPKKLGPFLFQGLIPKRRGEIAKSIGDMVESELLSQEDFINQVISDQDEEKFRRVLVRWTQGALLEKMSFLPRMVQERILIALEDKLNKESSKIFAEVRVMVENHIRNKVDIGGLVEEKVNALDLKMLEELTLKIAGKELQAIEWLGLIMGAGIGLIQGLVTIYLLS